MGESESKPTDDAQPRAADEQKQSRAKHSHRPIQVAIVSQVSPYPCSEDEPKRDKTPLWKIILEFLAIGLALIAAAIYGGQLWVMKGQLREMRTTTKATMQSAYASCVAAQISRSALIEVQRGESDTHGSTQAAIYQAMAATQSEMAVVLVSPAGLPTVRTGGSIDEPFYLVNSGKTAANRVNFHGRVELLERNAGVELRYPIKQTTAIEMPIMIAGLKYPLPAKDQVLAIPSIDRNGRTVHASQADVDQFMNGEKILYLYGRVTYQDIFGIHHWTQICMSYWPTSQSEEVSIHPDPKCTAYNKSDKNQVLEKLATARHDADTLPEISCKKPPEE